TMVPFVLALLLFPDFFITQLKLTTEQARLLPGAGRGLDAGPLLLGIVAIMLMLGAASDVSVQVLYAYFRQKMTNVLEVLNSLLIPGLQALLVVPLSVFGALIALLIGTAISVALSLRLMFHALGQERLGMSKPVPRPAPVAGAPAPRSIWRRFTAYSAMQYAMILTTALYDQSFVVLTLGLIIANREQLAVEVALIGLAFKFVRQLLQALVVPLTGVQTPLFSRLYAEGRIEGLRTAYASLTRFLILVLLPAGAGLILMSRNLLVLLYLQPGADAVLSPARLDAAVAACAILTVGLFGESMISVALNVLMVYEDYRAVLLARTVALLSVPLIVLLEPRFGVVGVAAAVATAALGSRLVALLFGLRRLGLHFPLGFLGRVMLATMAFVVIIGPLAFMLPATPDLGEFFSLDRLLLGLADGALVAGAVLLFWLAFRRLGGLLPEDKQRFAAMRLPGIKRIMQYL
ncbi:MAG TPA: hypothetical protein VM536_14040, partial [Chloroflexia bacterium]|nr:hypothetical protein [Chloroflexia bacterium]